MLNGDRPRSLCQPPGLLLLPLWAKAGGFEGAHTALCEESGALGQ